MRCRSLAPLGMTATMAVAAVSCTRDVEPTRPTHTVATHPTALVEITFSNIGSPNMTSSALVASSVAQLDAMRAARDGHGASFDLTVPRNLDGTGDATIELDLLGAGGVTVNGTRYFQATYRVRNAQKTDSASFNTARRNLTFVAVSTANTIQDTPVLLFKRQDGSPADAGFTHALLPTGLVAVDQGGALTTVSPDVLQVLTEPEVAAISVPSDVTNTFPYGFVVRRAGSTTTRTLDPSPSATTFQGVVSFAYRLPLRANPADDPTTVTVMMLALDDSDTRLTESLEEQTPAGQIAAVSRATSLGTSQLRLLPGGLAPGVLSSQTRLVCSVRTAGPANAPTATLVNVGSSFQSLHPSPYTAAGSFVPGSSPLQAQFSSTVQGASSANFIVRGFLGGQSFRGAAYTTSGSTATTPAGNFLVGDVIEVTITSALSCPTPWVGQLRIQVPTRSSGSLNAQTPYPTGDRPRAVAVGDFNRDGILDIASANFDDDNVTILRGNGAGQFTVMGTVSVGNTPASMVAVDLNGDGILDLATANTDANNVTVLLGRGDGTFAAAQSVAVGTGPTQIATGDLNGDGIPDLVTSNESSNNVSILLGNGNGTFQQRTIATGARPIALVLGDMNADGILDLAVATNGNGAVQILLGNGDGTFRQSPEPPLNVASNLTFLAIGDLTADGRLDIVATNNGSQNLTLLVGNGDGTFQPRQSIPAAGPQANSVTIGDMNGDGILDLVITRQSGNASTVSVLLGTGSGTFPARVDFDTGEDVPTYATLADLNRDGILDVVIGNDKNNANTIGVLLGAR